MADIDLTFVEIANEESEKKASKPTVHDEKEIAPRFTEGVKAFYFELGKNTPTDEKMALLEGMETDFIFDELKRRFKDLNRIIEGITSIVTNTEPIDVSPERIEALRADFKEAERIKKEFKEIMDA